MLICFGGMHGNELAGVEALDIIFRLLEIEPQTNPEFEFKGHFIGIHGNLSALEEKQRFIEKDLNRLWTDENVARILDLDPQCLNTEEKEVREIINIIHREIETYQPEKIVMLDLHTTTAHGGIFSIATDDPESVRIAVELHAPVIKGMLEGIKGTTLHYFRPDNFDGRQVVGVAFESGQHEDPLSVNRAIAATINCMRTIGCVNAEHVENRHDKLLIDFSKNLPKVSELIMCHSITEEDQFVMIPNYKNFQRIKKGELLAYDKDGPIYAESDGLILMPLYQPQGDDGFFVIKALEGY
jgi:succinylglutamate desuccinylase